jgi:TatD DNase family protein
MISDSHAHLDMPRFDADRDDVVRRAQDAGLELIVTIGTLTPDTRSMELTLALAERYPFVYAGLGVHPHDARLADEELWRKLEAAASHPKMVLWGEIGLDYYYDHSPRDIQRQAFRRQLRLAAERGLPVSIHCRDAWPDLVEILREEWRHGSRSGILHSFTGDVSQALLCTDIGFLISFSGMVSFRNAGALREVARGLAPEKVLVETDCPYLAPTPHRGKRNEPAFVVDVGRALAAAMDLEYETLAKQTTDNLRRLIRVPRP